MRWMALVLVLLAGCNSLPPGDQGGSAEPNGPADVADGAGTSSPRPLRRVVEAWSDSTYDVVCTIPAADTCVVATHDFRERNFSGVEADFWLNLTWQANDAANNELTVTLAPSKGEALTFSGPSPLSVHVAAPPKRFTMTVEGERVIDAVVYQDAPPQTFDAASAYLA